MRLSARIGFLLAATFPLGIRAAALPPEIYAMVAGRAQAAPGERGVRLPILGTHTEPLDGFSVGLRFEALAIALVAIDAEGTLVGQLDPDYFKANVGPGTGTVGVVMNFFGEQLLPMGWNRPLVWCTFDIAPGLPDGSVPIVLGAVGDPPVFPSYSVRGVSIMPPALITVDGRIRVGPVPAPRPGLPILPDDLSVHLRWRNGATYDAVEILRDGVVVARLAGDAKGFEDDPPPGLHTYVIAGVRGGRRSEPTSVQVHVGRIVNSVWVTVADRLLSFDLAGSPGVSASAGPASALAGIAVAPNGTIWAGDSARHRTLERATDGAALREFPVGGDAVAADRAGCVWAIDRTAGTVSRIAVDGRILLGGDGAGDSPEDGEEGPAVRLPDAAAVAVDRFGVAWVTQTAEDAAVRIAANGAILDRVPLPEGARPFGITVAPNRWAWVALSGLDRVAAIDPIGIIRKQVPTQARPTGVAIGVDGAIWATNLGARSVTRIDPARDRVDHFPLPAAEPHGIAADGLGRIWVACRSGALLRLSPLGAVLGSTPIPAGTRCLGDMTGFVVANVLRPFGDADGDGFTNDEETRAGSNPLDPSSDPTTVDPGRPAAVADLSCTARRKTVHLSWRVRGRYNEIRILRDDVQIAVLAGDSTGHEDEPVRPGRHRYAVIAVRGGASSLPAICFVRVGLGALLASRRIEASTAYDIARNCFDGSIYVVDRAPGLILHFDRDLAFAGSFYSPFGPGVTTGIAFHPHGDCSTGDPAKATLFVANGRGRLIQEIDLAGHPVGPPFPVIAPRRKIAAETPSQLGSMTFDPSTGLLACLDPVEEDIFPLSVATGAGQQQGEVDPDRTFEHVRSETGGPIDEGIAYAGEGPGGSSSFLLIDRDDEGLPVAEEVDVAPGSATAGDTEIPLDEAGDGLLSGLEVSEDGVVAMEFEGETLTLLDAEGGGVFLRGDANGDLSLDLADPISTLNWMFAQGNPPPCIDAADVDDSGGIDIGDAIYTLNFLFASGPAPKPPYPEPDSDPTPDPLPEC